MMMTASPMIVLHSARLDVSLYSFLLLLVLVSDSCSGGTPGLLILTNRPLIALSSSLANDGDPGGELPSDSSVWWDIIASPAAPVSSFTSNTSISITSQTGIMDELRRPVLIQAPEDSYIVRNRPAKLTCRAIYAGRISFKCEGEWVRQEEHEMRHGVEAVSELPYLEATVNVHRPDVGPNGIGCECYAYTTNPVVKAGPTVATAGGNFGVKSDKATVKIATLSKHFLQEPTSERQPVSSMVQLRCTPPDGEPKPEVYWLKDGREIEARADPNVIIAHDGSLIIAAARVTDSGLYTCGARNLANHRLSQHANVTIYENGHWSEWSGWSGECPEDCEEQARLLLPYPKLRRHRKCSHPSPSNGGQLCEGSTEQEMDCELPCPVNGQWSAWSEWGQCEPTASSSADYSDEYDYVQPRARRKNAVNGACRKKRTRGCDNPPPKNRGISCVGLPADYRNCTEDEICQGHGGRLASTSLQNGAGANGRQSSSPASSTDINLAMYTGLGAAAVVFLLVFFTLLALFIRRRASCHRCGGSSHYKEYESVAVRGNANGVQPQIMSQNGLNGKIGVALINGKITSRSGSGCALPPDLTRNAPLLIYDSAHPPSSLKSDQSRVGLLTSGGWSAQHSDSSGDRSHCATDDNYATVDDPYVDTCAMTLCGPSGLISQSNSLLSTLIPPNVPAAWTVMGAEGGCLQLPEYGVSLLIPPGAVPQDRTTEVFLAVLPDISPNLGSSTATQHHKTILSPVVWCGPVDLVLRKPVVLTFDHCAHLLSSSSTNGGWRVAVYENEPRRDANQDSEMSDLTPSQFNLSSCAHDWHPNAVVGRETLNTSVYCQIDPDCVHLLTDCLSRFVLVGEFDPPAIGASQSATSVSKRCRLLAFVSPSDCSVRIYCVDDTKMAVRRALNAEKESGAGGRLACEPQLFQLQHGADLCLCMEEVTPAWRRRSGANYQEIPAAHLWPSHSTATCTLAPIHCSFALETVAPQSERSMERGEHRRTAPNGEDDQQLCIQGRVIVYQKGDASGSRCVLAIDTTADWPTYVYGLERRMLSIKLPPELRLRVSNLLDQPNERENDWRMLARQLAVDHYLPYFAARPSPTDLILLLWESRERGPRAAVQLMQLFYAMQRPDAAELIALYLEEV